MNQQCPCGCDLQLSREDFAAEQRLAWLAGTHTGEVITFSPAIAYTTPDDQEPQVSGICRACGSRMEMPEYLAVFLQDHKAPWPECDGCARMTEH